MSQPLHANDRLVELLADSVTDGLSASDRDALDRLLSETLAGLEDEFERAAATVSLAMAAPAIEPMPAHLRERVQRDAARWLHPSPAATPIRFDAPRGDARREILTHPALPNRRLGAQRALAAAAALLFFALLWWHNTSPRATPVEEQYRGLIERATDLVRSPWKAGEPDYEQVTGEVVWSDAEQAGFMVLNGMPANAGRGQYQLWIVDPQRDERPVDGGVFDVADAAGPQIIPIRAALRVWKPAAFAITLEKEGGVVVSDGPLLVVASAGG